MSGEDRERLDRWLWHVRAFKTRSAATEACRGGHVKVNSHSAKAATGLRTGDVVTITSHSRERVLEVVSFPSHRRGASEASEAYVDLSPPPTPREAVPRREAGSGRPTKRERRQVDKLRRR